MIHYFWYANGYLYHSRLISASTILFVVVKSDTLSTHNNLLIAVSLDLSISIHTSKNTTSSVQKTFNSVFEIKNIGVILNIQFFLAKT